MSELQLRVGSQKSCTCPRCAPQAQPTEQQSVPAPTTTMAAAIAKHNEKDPTTRTLEQPFDLAAVIRAGQHEVK